MLNASGTFSIDIIKDDSEITCGSLGMFIIKDIIGKENKVILKIKSFKKAAAYCHVKKCKYKSCLRAIVHQKDSSDCYDCKRYMSCSSYKSKSTKPKINIGVIGHIELGKITLTEAVLKIIKGK